MTRFGSVEGSADEREGFLVDVIGIKMVKDQKEEFLGEGVKEVVLGIFRESVLLQGAGITGGIREDDAKDLCFESFVDAGSLAEGSA